jgi:hypothetical protein
MFRAAILGAALMDLDFQKGQIFLLTTTISATGMRIRAILFYQKKIKI